jgi:transcriptional regulator with XRE-family HTH domain
MNDPEPTDPPIEHRLRTVARILFDNNKSDFARAMGMKPSSFGKYLRGTRRPGATVLERLTRLGVSVDWLLTGEGPILLESASSQRRRRASREGTERAQRPPQTNQCMSAAELSGADPQFYPVPVVKARIENGNLHLDEVGEPEWVSARAIENDYGGEPNRLRTFVIDSDRMAPTIQTGDRVRGILLRSPIPPGRIVDGEVYLVHSTDRVWSTRLYRKRVTERDSDGEASEKERHVDESSPEPVAPRYRNEEILLSSDNPEASDRRLSLEEWTTRIHVTARLLEVMRPL